MVAVAIHHHAKDLKDTTPINTYGNFQILIMLAIQSMIDTVNEQQSVDANFTNNTSTLVSNITQLENTQLQSDTKAMADDKGNSEELQIAQAQFQKDQTQFGGLVQQGQGLVSTMQSATSQDSTNSSNFTQYATQIMALLNFVVQMLQQQL